MICLCCNHRADDFPSFKAREMMFGWREPFSYLECTACQSLQIERVPADLSRFYPPEYYAQQIPASVIHRPCRLRGLAAKLLTLPGGTVASRLTQERYPFLHWANLAQINQGSSVLDIGCGGGVHLRRMRRWGYRALTGIDPYITTELHEPGLRLLRRELNAVSGQFDLVMLHHVLEHMADPLLTLREAAARLTPGGRMLVRLPLAASPLAREFGADWFNLDAPRHLVIPSRAGLMQLFTRAGLRVTHDGYDSNELTVFYSECYRRNVAMHETTPPDAVPTNPAVRRRIARLNANRQGDYGVFVLETA